jgi:hypothetical protein
MMSGPLTQPWTARPLAMVAAVGMTLTAILGVAAHLHSDPGMSPLSLTISDYAVSNNGWPMNVAILVLGISSLSVPLALRAVRIRVGAVAEALLLVWCLGLIVSAIVPTDPIGVVELSTRAYVHRYVSVAAFVALPVATLLAIRRLATDARWRGTVRRLRALAVASVLALLGLYYVAFPGGRVMMGLVERILVLVELALLAVLVGQILRLGTRTRRSGSAVTVGTAPVTAPGSVRRPARQPQTAGAAATPVPTSSPHPAAASALAGRPLG